MVDDDFNLGIHTLEVGGNVTINGIKVKILQVRKTKSPKRSGGAFEVDIALGHPPIVVTLSPKVLTALPVVVDQKRLGYTPETKRTERKPIPVEVQNGR